MLFKCLPDGAQIPGRFPGPVHARGKWFTVDIHCHVLTPKAEEMVGGRPAADWQPREVHSPTSAPARSTASRPSAPASSSARSRSGSRTWTGWGSTSRRSRRRRHQTYYSADPDLGIATARVINDNLADICGRHPDRFSALGTVPFQAPDLAVAELDRLHKSLGLRGIEIATNVGGEDLSEPRVSARSSPASRNWASSVFMHPDRLPRGAAASRDHYLDQRDRQPARYDGRGAPPDLWRRPARPPQLEAGAVAWRRLSAGLFRAHRSCRLGPAGHLRTASARCRRPI